MPVTPHDRPIQALREETVDQLIMNYGHGKLSRVAFERRLDMALDSKTHDELLELTQDLDLTTDVQYAAKKKAELDIRMTSAAPADSDKVDHMINIFGGGNRGGIWDVPEEIRMINIFGGANLDFTDARFAARTTRITMFCLFGGANFYVPEGMRTVSKALCVFGGVNNRAPSPSVADAPTLLISGLTLFGGVNIRVKKSVKQRLYEFANALRTLFGTREPPRI